MRGVTIFVGMGACFFARHIVLHIDHDHRRANAIANQARRLAALDCCQVVGAEIRRYFFMGAPQLALPGRDRRLPVGFRSGTHKFHDQLDLAEQPASTFIAK